MSNIVDICIAREQQYQMHIGIGLQDSFSNFCKEHFSDDAIIVLIDEHVNRLHRNRVENYVQYFEEAYFFMVPEGESSKSVDRWKSISDDILGTGIERATPILAVGGGVTGDLTGFIASTVLRGVPLMHMPTTLLAMVDSSIGGKTGVNHPTGKNLIGSFYQPRAIFADIAFLETLNQKQWITGMAEIIKYAAIRNPELFEELEDLIHDPQTSRERWISVIEESARIKVDIVQEDALEAGKRAYLNFGHTFGHALEKESGYGKISHGEAVFAGMIAACHFSEKLGHPVNDARFDSFLSLYQQQMSALPTEIDNLIETMKSDKKVKNNIIRLVLLNDWGSPYLYPCEDLSLLRESWQYLLKKFNG